MWSLKLTTEQRYKYFEPILPDQKADIKLFIELYMKSDLFIIAARGNKSGMLGQWLEYILDTYKSFMIERTLDNNYTIKFYE